jgi:hypothetical protein
MKLETKSIEVFGSLGEKTIDATISQEKLSKLWDMLQNPYKNNIGSIVREITSNCFDSHKEAGIDDAVVIRYSKDESGFYVSFIDVGVGLSPDRVESIFVKYLESTKELTNELIGGFGIGSKSPLSYQDMFYINTRYAGIEYNYIMRKGEMSPKIDLLKKKLTSERNGTEIKLYIKSEQDLLKFLQETFTQLHYFKNVVVDLNQIEPLYKNYSTYGYALNINKIINKLNEDYILVEGHHFIWRTNTEYQDLHLSIGNVYYPIDWSNLGVNFNSHIVFPVALKFEIGELPVIQTREDIRYTDEAILKIKEKIELLKEEAINLYNKQPSLEVESLKKFLFQIDLTRNFLQFDIDGSNYSLSLPTHFVPQSKLNAYQIKDFNYVFKSKQDNIDFNAAVNVGNYMFNGFHKDPIRQSFKPFKTFKTNGSLMSLQYNDKLQLSHYSSLYLEAASIGSVRQVYDNIHKIKQYIKSGDVLLLKCNETITTKKNKYLMEVLHEDIHPQNMYFLQVQPFKFTLKALYKWYVKTFKINYDWEVFIKFFKRFSSEIQEELDDLFVDYDAIQVDEKWWKDKLTKAKASKETVDYDRSLMAIEKYKVNCYIYSSNGEWNRKDYRENIETIINNHSIKILITIDEQKQYCSNNNDWTRPFEKLIQMIDWMKYQGIVKHNVTLLATKQRNYDKILKFRKESSNIFTLSEFLNDKKMQTRYLGKLATIIKLKQAYLHEPVFHFGSTMKELDSIITVMNPDLVNLYKEVNTIINCNVGLDVKQYEDLLKDFDALDQEVGIYDADLVNKYNTIVEFVKESRINFYDKDYLDVFNFIMSYKPSKTQFRFYKDLYVPLTEDVICNKYNTTKKLTLEEVKNSINFTGRVGRSSYSRSYTNFNTLTYNNDLITLWIMKYEYNQQRSPITVNDMLPVVEEVVETIEVEEEVTV